MQFDVSSSELLKGLQATAGAISTNPVLPVLEDFLFDIKASELTITASNLETTIVTKVPVQADGALRVAIPARILLETLKALPDQPIIVLIEEDTFGIEIKSSYGKYRLAGDNPEDFPELPAETEVDTFKIHAGSLLNAINRTIFATSNDDMRLAMTGIFVQVDFNKVTFVSTDAHKLVKYTFAGIASDTTASFILPKKVLGLIKGALDNEEMVTVSFNAKNAFFKFGNQYYICRLIDAKYPDYNAVIPVENPYELVVDRKDLQNSLRRIAIYANKSTNQVIINITEDSLTISAQDLDFSNEATETLRCQYNGDAMNMGFNAKFFAEMLGVLETDEVKMELSTPNRAGILYPAEQEENETLLMLVMPVLMSS